MQVLVYMYSEVLQLVTFKSQDRFQTTGLSFPLIQPKMEFISVLSVALTQRTATLGCSLDQMELLLLVVVSSILPTNGLGNSE